MSPAFDQKAVKGCLILFVVAALVILPLHWLLESLFGWGTTLRTLHHRRIAQSQVRETLECLYSAQERFKLLVIADRNANGIGEYAILDELCRAWQTHTLTLEGFPCASYACIDSKSGSFKANTSYIAFLWVSPEPGLQERQFICLAQSYHELPLYMIDQSGVISRSREYKLTQELVVDKPADVPVVVSRLSWTALQ